MNDRIGYVLMALMVATGSFANPIVSNALFYVTSSSELCSRQVIAQTEEYGLPALLVRNSRFRTLVDVVSNQHSNCSSEYVMTLTNGFERALFIGALAESGLTPYTNVLVRVFGSMTGENQTKCLIITDFINSIGTKLEDYAGLHYAEPGISNVLLSARAIYASQGETKLLNWVNRLLSGDYKREHDELEAADAL